MNQIQNLQIKFYYFIYEFLNCMLDEYHVKQSNNAKQGIHCKMSKRFSNKVNDNV